MLQGRLPFDMFIHIEEFINILCSKMKMHTLLHVEKKYVDNIRNV